MTSNAQLEKRKLLTHVLGMRRDLKDKLDALERAEKLKRWLTVAIVSGIVAAAAFLYTRPSTALGTVPAAVERSVVGVDHWGQEFHQLRARLSDQRIVPVDTFLIKRPLPVGQRVTLTSYQGFWGNVFYRLQPDGLSQHGQSR